jgi:hypothetical protein
LVVGCRVACFASSSLVLTRFGAFEDLILSFFHGIGIIESDLCVDAFFCCGLCNGDGETLLLVERANKDDSFLVALVLIVG